MSMRGMEAAVLTDAPTASAKAVMVALGYSHNQETGLCIPGRKRLAKLSGLKERTIYDAIAALVGAKLIEVERRYRASDGMRTSDSYKLLFATPDAIRQRLIEDEMNAAETEQDDTLPADIAKPAAETSGGFREESGRLVVPAAKTFAAGATQERGRERSPSPGTQDLGEEPAISAARRIWGHVPEAMQTDREKIALTKELRVAAGQDLDVQEIAAGLIRYYQFKAKDTSGVPTKKPMFAVRDGVWNQFHDSDVHPRAGGAAPAVADPQLLADIGTTERPGHRLQVRWMEGWVEKLPGARGDYWKPEWGPPPGAPGCRVDPQVQRDYGVEPFQEGGGANA